MNIQSIQFKNFKGLTRSLDAGALNLFLGGNGCGKTAVLLGIRFAMTGETPHGRRPMDAWKMSGPTGCSVTITLDDGFSWTRALRKHRRNGTIRTELDVAGEEHLGVADSEALIRDRVGAFAPTWTARETLSQSPDKLRDFILGLCGSNGTTCDLDSTVLSERIRRRFLEAEANVPADKLSMDQLREDFADAPLLGHAASTIVGAMIGKTDPAAAAAMLSGLTAAREAANATKALRDEKQAAARALRERIAEIQVEADTATDHAEALATVREEIRVVDEQIGEARERATSIQDADGRLRGLREKHRVTVHDLEHIHAVDLGEAESADAEANELHDDLADVPDLVGAEQAANAAVQAELQASALVDACDRDYTAQDVEFHSLSRRLERLAGDPWAEAVRRFNVLIAALAADDDDGLCAGFHDWLAGRSSIEESLAATERKVTCAKRMDELNAHRKTLDAAANEATDKSIAAQADEADAKAAHDARATTIDSAETLRAKARMIRDRHATTEADRVRLAKLVDEINTDSNKIEDQLHELRLDGLTSGGLDEERAALAIREQAILDAAKSAEQAKALQTELDTVVASCERQGRLHDIYKGLADAVRALREEIMAEAVRPLIKHVQAFLDAANMGRRAYCDLAGDTGRPAFDLGWSDGTTRVSLDVLSGGETTIFVAAVAYAMVRLADVPLRLLLIEAAEVDAQHMARLLEAIEITCKEGPQAFLATHAADPLAMTSARPWLVNHMELVEVAV